MSFREELQKRIDKKRAEITSLEGKLREAQIYIQALEDTLKLVPRENGDTIEVVASSLREGSIIARAKEELSKAGRPLHISELLGAMGRPDDKDNRAALASSIGAYVRKGGVFTRPAPNTFGLLEMRAAQRPPGSPPPDFGVEAAEVPVEEEPEDAEFTF